MQGKRSVKTKKLPCHDHRPDTDNTTPALNASGKDGNANYRRKNALQNTQSGTLLALKMS